MAVRGALAVAHGQDDRGRAAHDVAAGEDARHARHALLVDDEVAPLVDAQVRLARGEHRVAARADGHDDHVARR